MFRCAADRAADDLDRESGSADPKMPVLVGERHHGGVAMAVTVIACRLHLLLDLGVGEVLARACVGIGPSLGPLT